MRPECGKNENEADNYESENEDEASETEWSLTFNT